MTKKPTAKKPRPSADLPFAPPDWPAARPPQMIKVSVITAHPKNPKVHPDGQLTAMGKAFDEFGVVVPPVVDENFRLMAGEGRWLTAKKKSIEELPCIVVSGWSEAKKLRFMFADNHLSTLSSYDDAAYRAVLQMIKDDNGDLGALGLDAATLSQLLFVPSEKDPDETPEPPADPVSRPGDLWVLGEHRLLCGDSTKPDDVTRALDGAKPKLMVTDPPYGVDYDPSWRAKVGVNKNKDKLGEVKNDDRADWTDAWMLFDGNVAYVWHGGLHSGTVEQSLVNAGFVTRSQIIWNKDRFALSRGDYHWRHEPALYAVRAGKAGGWHGDRKQDTVWNIPAREDGGHGHSTQKPVECMRRPIQNNSQPGDVVYEPFSGSGTTIIAAEMMNRPCRAIELSPTYVDVGVRRWQTFAKGTATLAGDGRTFEEIAKERLKGGKNNAARDPGKSVRGRSGLARPRRKVAK